MRLHVSNVLAAEKERLAKPKPLPTIKIGGVAKVEKPKIKLELKVELPVEQLTQVVKQANTLEEDILWQEMVAVKKRRNILSSHGTRLVMEIEERLRKESGEHVAQEFMNGNLPMPELAEHYAKVQAISDEAKVLYDRITHIQNFGTAPAHEEATDAPNESAEAKSVQHEIRRLDDLIYKTKKKVKLSQGGIKAPKKSDRFHDWMNKISMAELRRDDLKLKLKGMR